MQITFIHVNTLHPPKTFSKGVTMWNSVEKADTILHCNMRCRFIKIIRIVHIFATRLSNYVKRSHLNIMLQVFVYLDITLISYLMILIFNLYNAEHFGMTQNVDKYNEWLRITYL